MSKELRFHDKTILSTPDPVHSSSMLTSKSRKNPSVNFIHNTPEKFDLDEESLGILSFTSDDSNFPMSSARKLREKEKEQALHSLKEFDRQSINLTSIPSRFLKRSDVTVNTPGARFNHSDSTISETDLIPGDCSTPRGSLLQEEFVMKQRPSMSKSIQTLISSVRSANFDLANMRREFQKTANFDVGDESFQSGSLAMAKLEEDEELWKKENDLPVTCKEFSVGPDPRFSVGSFFIKKSDNLPKMFARSPEKTQRPIALIETSSAIIENCNNNQEKDSINISDIQKILCDQTTTHALDVFLNTKTNTQSKSPSSDVSDSEGLKSKFFVEQVKENISPEEPKSTSSRASSSLSTLPNGKLPIATTKSEIIWGCLKLGKTHCQEFILRNRSSSRLGIQCSVSNPSFRLSKDGLEANNTNMMKIILHPYESRSLAVAFSPTALGAAVDNLNFTSSDFRGQHTVKQFIKLYGYGGCGNVVFENMIKDTSGKFLLSLGNIDRQYNLRQTFIIKNTGSLATFIYFDFHLNNLHSVSNLEVSPQTSILLPGGTAEVVVSYHLQKTDFHYFKSTVTGYVIDIGKLQVYYGTEANRARLRKVCNRAKERNVQIHQCVLKVINKLPNEVIPSDLKLFKESIASLDDVIKLIHKEDITVTLEQDIDHTLSEQFQDETAMFQSLCENTAMDRSEACRDGCQVEPTRIILTPPDKVRDRIFLTNNHLNTVYFEINTTPEGLYLKPREGTIKAGETVAIDLMYVKQCHDKTVFKVIILVDNECFDVEVKIMYVKSK